MQLKFSGKNTFEKNAAHTDNECHRQWKPVYKYATNDTYYAYLTNKNIVKLLCF